MAAAQAPGTDGSEGGGTSSREEALQVAQLGRGRHRGESGGPTRVRQKLLLSPAFHPVSLHQPRPQQMLE